MRTDDHQPREALAAALGLTEAALHDTVFACPQAQQATLGRVSARAIWDEVARRFGLDAAGLAAFEQAFWAGDHFDVELARWAGGLRPRLQTGILSNAWDSMRTLFVEDVQLYRYFDSIVISAEVGMAKPDPAIYRLCARRMGVALNEMIFVDDMPHNIDAANALGMHGVLFRSAAQARADILACLAAS